MGTTSAALELTSGYSLFVDMVNTDLSINMVDVCSKIIKHFVNDILPVMKRYYGCAFCNNIHVI